VPYNGVILTPDQEITMALNLVSTATQADPNQRSGIIRGFGPDGATEYWGYGSQAEVDRFNRDAKQGWTYTLDVDPPPSDPWFKRPQPAA
jgi:hypothetical protein